MRIFIAGLVLLLALPFDGFGQDEKSVVPAPMAESCALFDQAVNVRADHNDAGDALQTRLLAIYNAQAHLVHSLKASAFVRIIRGPKFGPKAGKSKEIAGFIYFEQPTRIRITGVGPPLGKTVFDLASDGREIHLLAPDHNIMKFFVGPADALPSGSDANDLVHPREFLDALRWQEGTLRKTVETRASSAAQNDTLEFDLPPRAGKSVKGKLQFDLRSGAVTSLQLYDSEDKLLSTLRYADWRTVGDAAGGSSRFCFARQVQLSEPIEELEIDIRILELTLNPRLSKSDFRISPARGTPIVHLDSGARQKQH